MGLRTFSQLLTHYTVSSSAPQPTDEQLLGAGTDYPQWVTDHYLQLPQLPNRVEELAHQIAGDASTPHDRDMVDFFLFEAQTGYCDYYTDVQVSQITKLRIAHYNFPSVFLSSRHSDGLSNTIKCEGAVCFGQVLIRAHRASLICSPGTQIPACVARCVKIRLP